MSRRPSLKRTISSKSLLGYAETATKRETELLSDDSFSLGDEELHIEYYNVPRRLLFQGALHTLLQFKFFPLLFLILSGLVLILALTAGIYYAASDSCGLDLHSYTDAWLFAVLTHWKTTLAPGNAEDPFWRGCISGSTALFFHLFVAHILASVLLSALAFNFQSISRRSISAFNTLTLGRKARIASCPDGKIALSISVVERNETSKRKVSNVVANVFAFDPSEPAIRTIACNVAVGDVFLPQDIRVEIPGFSGEKKSDQECSVCGKIFRNILKHLNGMIDAKHGELKRSLGKEESVDIMPLTEADIVRSLRSREIQFIVILEGSDPITTDRVQVQKIFRNTELVPDGGLSVEQSVVTTEPDGHIAVDYKSFL